MSSHPSTVMRGVFYMMSAVTVFTVMSAFIKAADRVPAGEAMFFRSVWAMPVLVIWLMTHGGIRAGIRTASVRNHAVRGIVGSCAMGLGFAGLKYLPLPEVTAIRFMTPIIMVVLAALMLGERVSPDTDRGCGHGVCGRDYYCRPEFECWPWVDCGAWRVFDIGIGLFGGAGAGLG